MTPRPASFEPFDSGDPVPGDSYETAALARRLSDTATEIATQVANLRKLAEHSTEFWVGKAAAKFHDSASDLAGRIDKARGRYERTGAALSGWAKEIEDAQAVVYPAVRDAQEAQHQLDSTKPLPDAPAGSPPPTDADKAQAKQRANAHADAQNALDAARRRYDDAVSAYNSKAKSVAGEIRDASDHDGLKDSWWDRNFHWLSVVMKVIAIIIVVLAVVAILIACPLTAGMFAGLIISAETLATVVDIATAVLVLASLGFDSAAALTGKQGWTPAILDAVSLCTFGFGKLAGVAVKGMSGYGAGVAKGVVAGRAGRAALKAAGYPRIVWSAASKGGLRPLFDVFPKLSRAFQGADKAVTAAQSGLEDALSGIERSNIASMLTQSEKVAANFAKTRALPQLVPKVGRLIATKVASDVVVAADAIAQSSTFAVASSYTAYSQIKELFEEHELERRLDEIVKRWSQPLVPVP